MCPQLRVSVGRVGIGIPRRREDGAALDARIYRLLENLTLGSKDNKTHEDPASGAKSSSTRPDRTVQQRSR